MSRTILITPIVAAAATGALLTGVGPAQAAEPTPVTCSVTVQLPLLFGGVHVQDRDGLFDGFLRASLSPDGGSSFTTTPALPDHDVVFVAVPGFDRPFVGVVNCEKL